MTHRLLSLRAFVGLCVIALSCASFAQTQPKNLQPLPDIPPPPRLSTTPLPDDPEEPTVTIRQAPEGKVEEFRAKDGRVYAIRVTPKIGKPYLLVDPDGKGIKAEEIGNGVKPAQWTILEF
jgi:Protein of unknown function (DUF2782)